MGGVGFVGGFGSVGWCRHFLWKRVGVVAVGDVGLVLEEGLEGKLVLGCCLRSLQLNVWVLRILRSC